MVDVAVGRRQGGCGQCCRRVKRSGYGRGQSGRRVKQGG